MRTDEEDYARRLRSQQSRWWKRVLRVQAIYQWNIRREHLGRTLDVGCGLGRNLASLPRGSVGVDHNEVAVKDACSQGLTAVTVEEFEGGPHAVPEGYDALLFAHVIEHMSRDDGHALVRTYLPYLRHGGTVLFICPQERGYSSDPTHVTFTTGEDLQALARDVGLDPQAWRSFPLPRAAGRLFTYNEFVVRAQKP